MRRREFITLLGSAVALGPLAARAQQPAMPLVAFVNAGSAQGLGRSELQAYLKGLGETGYIEGQNVSIEYHWAERKNERLPAIMADLVHRQVSVIAATSTPAALAAQAATTTIPIVFETGSDPIQLGLVGSLNSPGGNMTGVTSMIVEVAPKRLELLHELLPAARVMALLVNSEDRALAQAQTREVLSAGRRLGLEVHVLNASNERDFDVVFANLSHLSGAGVVIGAGSVFNNNVEELAALTVRHRVPAIYQFRSFAAAGGLMSYGSDLTESELHLNLKTAKVTRHHSPTLAAWSCRRGVRVGQILLHRMSLLLAQSGHFETEFRCPLLGVKRTLVGGASMSLLTQSGHRRLRIAAPIAWLVSTPAGY